MRYRLHPVVLQKILTKEGEREQPS